MNVEKSKWMNRLIVYILGLFILALGVAFSINSELGVSPVNSLPYVISIIVGKEMGVCVIAVFLLYILLQIFILRKEFKWIHLTQMIFSTIFGYFVDFAKMILGNFSIPTYAGQLVMMSIGIVLVALGVSLYVNVNLINMPMEGLTEAVQRKLFKKLAFHDVKVIMDCLVVAIGIVLSFIFIGNIVGIREGTILSAILVGKIMKQLQRVVEPFMEKVCA